MNQTITHLPDLNLLRLFVALAEERHVTRAGERLFLSQPAASGGLKRLRAQFGDPLLVRQAGELRLTPRAEALYAAIAPRLRQLDAEIAAATPFDPAQDARSFVLGATDAVAFALLPPLLARLRRQAPLCGVSVRTGDHRTLPAMLAQGEIGTALGFLGQDLPANARMRVLGHSDWMLLRDPATPPVTSLEEYCARPHALISPRGDLGGLVDALLRQQGLSRRVVVGVSSFALLSAVLPGTDLVATVPDFVAERLSLRGLAAQATPISPAALPHAMAWTEGQDRDPAERWFRGLLGEIFTEVFGRAQR
ncbi:LysR family transcriptional regulator [Pseudoroseomonas cervicalis]|uniref:Transcriptional regulator, LysR family n=1 Tax=Pseudoroseomonas cervicalis ATCC 49957 TaxID=525371 RepID=D5RS86_9PROT|nr:LysR family transcriptional regulator [Pseudoroseomonas cervicalis]EFH09824.1 transcriptional regulator, LysR family [Pseudoroseomonas cervicalis ATCC 49957]